MNRDIFLNVMTELHILITALISGIRFFFFFLRHRV